jgi:hypothetical protein
MSRRAISWYPLIVLAVAAVAAHAVSAHAVTVGTLTTTLSSSAVGATGVTYTFGTYTNGNGEMATGATIAFPAGTDVRGATAVSPTGSVTVSNQTVTVTFATPVPRGATYTIAIGGITNPTTAGVRNVGNITFYLANPNNNNPRTPQDHPTADYMIGDHFVTLTITTPDDGQSIDFGSVDPGVTTASKTVTVGVSSSAPYTLTRSVADAALLGLAVTGDASRIGDAGTAEYTDSFTLTPPWTTEPEVPLVATVTYTVTH